MTWLILGSLIPGLLVSWTAACAVRRWAARLGLVDQPGERKVHTHATPLGGGLAIWLGIVLPLAAGQALAWMIVEGRAGTALFAWAARIPVPGFVEPHLDGLVQQAGDLWLLLAAATVVMLLGLVDDLRRIAWQPRLLVEAAVAVALVWHGWRLSLFIDVPWLTAAVSVVWIVALINSFNMLDNMDGLSGGVAAIAALMLAAVLLLAPDPSTSEPQLFVAGLLLVVVGSLVGFLWHNRPPARLFMGDAGAYLIGLILAVATILATFAGGDMPRHAILAPLCVLAVPLYDLVTVVAIRLRRGLSPFAADKNHFSHRLVDLGMSKTQAVLTIYLATATTGLGALLLHQVDTIGAVIILLVVASVLTLIGILETTARRQRRP